MARNEFHNFGSGKCHFQMERGGYVANSYSTKIREAMAHVAVAMEREGIDAATRLAVVNEVIRGLPQ